MSRVCNDTSLRVSVEQEQRAFSTRITLKTSSEDCSDGTLIILFCSNNNSMNHKIANIVSAVSSDPSSSVCASFVQFAYYEQLVQTEVVRVVTYDQRNHIDILTVYIHSLCFTAT